MRNAGQEYRPQVQPLRSISDHLRTIANSTKWGNVRQQVLPVPRPRSKPITALMVLIRRRGDRRDLGFLRQLWGAGSRAPVSGDWRPRPMTRNVKTCQTGPNPAHLLSRTGSRLGRTGSERLERPGFFTTEKPRQMRSRNKILCSTLSGNVKNSPWRTKTEKNPKEIQNRNKN